MIRQFWERHPRASRAVDWIMVGWAMVVMVATIAHAAPLLWR